jgi:hypothetical protein
LGNSEQGDQQSGSERFHLFIQSQLSGNSEVLLHG